MKSRKIKEEALKNYQLLKTTVLLFGHKRGGLLAAGTAFYIMLSLVPLILLIIRAVGLLIGDVLSTQNKFFDLAVHFIPDATPEILLKARELIQGPMYAGGKFTFINSAILMVSALSFFSAIWSAMYLFTEDKSYLSFKKHLKGVIILALTLSGLVFIFSLPHILSYLQQFFTNNFLVNFFYEQRESLRPVIDFFRDTNTFKSSSITVKAFLFFFSIFYFSLIYRWLFSWKISRQVSFIGGGYFVLSFVGLRSLFWVYLKYVRENLVKNYGDYYTLIVAVMWIYFVVVIFYFGICLCHTIQQKKWCSLT